MTPAEALRVWAREAPAEWVEDWQLQALGEAADLAAEERDLGPPVREPDRLAFARRRDRLESACEVLDAAGQGQTLRAVLSDLDAGRGTPTPGPSLPDPVLRAVLLNEPEAWWARLAEPAAQAVEADD